MGGAELRLPYLAGTLGLPLKKAVPANLAVSLLTLVAALPTRLLTLKTTVAGLIRHHPAGAILIVGHAGTNQKILQSLSQAKI